MSNFFILGKDKDTVEKFFSVLPEESRPRIVTDKESPAAWDHQTDDPTVIITDDPRTDTDAKELIIDDKQADDVIKEMTPEEQGEVVSEDPLAEETAKSGEPETSAPPVASSFQSRGFKVGKIL